MLMSTDPKFSPNLIICIVDIKKLYDFGKPQNEGKKILPKRQPFTLNEASLRYALQCMAATKKHDLHGNKI